MTEAESMQSLKNPISNPDKKNLENFKLGIKNIVYQISIANDGDLWCALMGRDLEEGISGFGKSVQDALHELANKIQNL